MDSRDERPGGERISSAASAGTIPIGGFGAEARALVRARSVSPMVWLLAGGLAVHLLMLAYDLAHPAVFLNADRADVRLNSVDGFLGAWASRSTADFLSSHGIAGDYLLQAIIMGAGGPAGLIIAQIALALLAGFAVYRLGRLLGLAEKPSTVAAAIFLLLPHTLLFPHQLASEALYTPLLAIAVWLAAEVVARPSAGLLLLAALLLGLANLIRPVSLLWPVLVGCFFWACGRRHAGVCFAFVSLLPVLVWMAFIGLQTGKFGMGESAHDMGHNLYQRVARISQTMPDYAAARVRIDYLNQGPRGSLPADEYLRFGLEHPLPFLRHAARDTAVFLGKSGIERIPIDYLMVNAEARSQLQNEQSGWRVRLERDGVGAAVQMLWQAQGPVLLASVVGSLLLLVAILLAAIGGRHLMAGFKTWSPVQRFVTAQLVCLPLYILVFSQVVDALQSRHRAPAEAAIVVLAVVGYLQVERARRHAGKGEAA